jgi:hypothetical protein
MRLARVRGTKITNPFRPRVDDEHVLVGMGFLLATVKKCLFLYRPRTS